MGGKRMGTAREGRRQGDEVRSANGRRKNSVGVTRKGAKRGKKAKEPQKAPSKEDKKPVSVLRAKEGEGHDKNGPHLDRRTAKKTEGRKTGVRDRWTTKHPAGHDATVVHHSKGKGQRRRPTDDQAKPRTTSEPDTTQRTGRTWTRTAECWVTGHQGEGRRENGNREGGLGHARGRTGRASPVWSVVSQLCKPAPPATTRNCYSLSLCPETMPTTTAYRVKADEEEDDNKLGIRMSPSGMWANEIADDRPSVGMNQTKTDDQEEDIGPRRQMSPSATRADDAEASTPRPRRATETMEGNEDKNTTDMVCAGKNPPRAAAKKNPVHAEELRGEDGSDAKRSMSVVPMGNVATITRSHGGLLRGRRRLDSMSAPSPRTMPAMVKTTTHDPTTSPTAVEDGRQRGQQVTKPHSGVHEGCQQEVNQAVIHIIDTKTQFAEVQQLWFLDDEDKTANVLLANRIACRDDSNKLMTA